MKAIFSPGPSFSNPKVREVAGWVRILDLYKEALEQLGYSVFIPEVPAELIDQSSTVSKITSYDLVAASQLPLDAALFLGPPGYSLAQMMSLRRNHKHWQERVPTFEGGTEWKEYWTGTQVLLYVWNNADWWRDQQLTPEYRHHQQPYDLSPTWRWVNKTALEMCDHVIACSPWVKWTHSKVVAEEKISLAFWGVDSQTFTPAPEEPPGFRILFVGGDPIRKGLIYLIEALKGMKDVELWVVGCSPFRETHDPTFRQFGMIPFKDMPHLYRQAHVLVCPTLEDGIALCVQEAMASGLPVITSPETAEVFEGYSYEAGFKVGYRDVATIRERLLWLKNNPADRRVMAAGARAIAEQQTWEKTKEAVKAIIRGQVGS